MAITNDARIGDLWARSGVQRIMVDLETYGKADRQRNRDTVKSQHALSDVRAMRRSPAVGHLVVRTEPVSLPSWAAHADGILAEGPDSVMIPMVETPDEVARAIDVVGDRSNVIVMIETGEALHQIDQIMATAPHATFFVGLNDLHMQLGHHFMFEPLAGGHVDAVAQAAHRASVPFGFGGLARPGHGLVDSAAVIREHERLGSTLAILARSFFGALSDPTDGRELETEIARLREIERSATGRADDERRADASETRIMIERVAALMAEAEVD